MAPLKRLSSKRDRGRVALDDVHVRAGQPVGEPGCEFGIDLDRRQVCHPLAQDIRRGAVAGTDLDDVVAQIGVSQRPRQDHVAHHGAPFVAGTCAAMFGVHSAHRTVGVPMSGTGYGDMT